MHISELYGVDGLSKYEIEHKRELLWSLGRYLLLNAPQLYIDGDVEADGIPGHGSMQAIGAVSIFGDEFHAEIRPYTDKFITDNRDFSADVGYTRERLLDEGKELTYVMRSFSHWIGTSVKQYGKQGPVLVTFGAAFDAAHIDLGFALSNIKNPLGIKTEDIKSYALSLDNTLDFSKTSKSKLPALIIPDDDFTHNPLEDSKWQQKVHCGLVAIRHQLQQPDEKKLFIP